MNGTHGQTHGRKAFYNLSTNAFGCWLEIVSYTSSSLKVRLKHLMTEKIWCDELGQKMLTHKEY